MWKYVLLLCGVVVTIVGCEARIETKSLSKNPSPSPSPEYWGGGFRIGSKPSQPERAKSAAKPIEQRANGPQVSVAMRLSQAAVRPGDEVEVAVEVKIAPMWEIHPLNAEPAETATKLELITPEGIRTEGEWSEPKTARSMGASGQPVHMGNAVFKRSLVVDAIAVGDHEIICKVGYQVCNEQQCLKPEVLTLSVPLVVRE